jgi:hypothetical protein
MADLYLRYEDGTSKKTTQEEVLANIRDGQWADLKEIPSINMHGPDGKMMTLPFDHDTVKDALGRGWSFADSEQERIKARNSEYGNTFGDEVLALGLGAMRGATLGLSDMALEELGVDADVLEGYKEGNPDATLTGEIAGALGPGVVGYGGSLAKGAAQVVPSLGVKKGLETAMKATPAYWSARLAGHVEKKIMGDALKQSAKTTAKGYLGKKVMAEAASGATEGALFGAGQAVSESYLQDQELTGEALMHGVGLGVAFGGAVGAGVGGVAGSLGYKKMFDPRQKITAKHVKDKGVYRVLETRFGAEEAERLMNKADPQEFMQALESSYQIFRDPLRDPDGGSVALRVKEFFGKSKANSTPQKSTILEATPEGSLRLAFQIDMPQGTFKNNAIWNEWAQKATPDELERYYNLIKAHELMEADGTIWNMVGKDREAYKAFLETGDVAHVKDWRVLGVRVGTVGNRNGHAVRGRLAAAEELLDAAESMAPGPARDRALKYASETKADLERMAELSKFNGEDFVVTPTGKAGVDKWENHDYIMLRDQDGNAYAVFSKDTGRLQVAKGTDQKILKENEELFELYRRNLDVNDAQIETVVRDMKPLNIQARRAELKVLETMDGAQRMAAEHGVTQAEILESGLARDNFGTHVDEDVIWSEFFLGDKLGIPDAIKSLRAEELKMRIGGKLGRSDYTERMERLMLDHFDYSLDESGFIPGLMHASVPQKLKSVASWAMSKVSGKNARAIGEFLESSRNRKLMSGYDDLAKGVKQSAEDIRGRLRQVSERFREANSAWVKKAKAKVGNNADLKTRKTSFDKKVSELDAAYKSELAKVRKSLSKNKKISGPERKAASARLKAMEEQGISAQTLEQDVEWARKYGYNGHADAQARSIDAVGKRIQKDTDRLAQITKEARARTKADKEIQDIMKQIDEEAAMTIPDVTGKTTEQVAAEIDRILTRRESFQKKANALLDGIDAAGVHGGPVELARKQLKAAIRQERAMLDSVVAKMKFDRLSPKATEGLVDSIRDAAVAALTSRHSRLLMSAGAGIGSLLGGVPGAVTGTMLANRLRSPAFVISALIKAEQATIRTWNSGASRLLRRTVRSTGRQATTAAYLFSEHKLDTDDKRLAYFEREYAKLGESLGQSAQELDSYENLANHAPQIKDAARGTMERAGQYLQQVAPQVTIENIGTPLRYADDEAVKDWIESYTIIKNPNLIIKYAEAETLTPAMVQAMRTVYPGQHRIMVKSILERAERMNLTGGQAAMVEMLTGKQLTANIVPVAETANTDKRAPVTKGQQAPKVRIAMGGSDTQSREYRQNVLSKSV